MIVVDTNVIASMWVQNNDVDEWVYKALKKDSDWVAPLGAQSLEMYYPYINERFF